MGTREGRGTGSQEVGCLTPLLHEAKSVLKLGTHTRAGARACFSKMTVTIGAWRSLSRC